MSSKYADEGTIAHALAAMCLTEGKPAAAYVGRIIESEDYEHSKLSPSGAYRWMLCPGSTALEARIAFVPRKFSLEVTEEMAEGVQVYLDNIEKYRLGIGHSNADCLVEQRLPIDHITGEAGATGSADFVILDYGAAEIQLHDLKFGKGVPVSAHENKQLRLYGLGAIEHYAPLAPEGGWKTFRAIIHQPRIMPAPDEWACSIEDLLAFGVDAANAANLANACRTRPVEELRAQGLIVPGDSQCKFCDAKATCPEVVKLVSQTVLGGFENLDAPGPAPAAVPVPATSDAERLALYYGRLELIESWCTAVASAVEAALHAGEKVPGLKLVQGRRGNRAWSEPEKVEELLKSFRLKQDEMYTFKLITPPQAQKVLKDKPKRWAKVAELVTQSEGKPTVAPESDPRPAIVVQPTAAGFANLEEEQLV